MTLDLTFYALAIPAVVIAGISKGGFGSGAAFVAAPILALVVSPAMAVGLMLPLLMLIDLVTLKPYWGQWPKRESWLLILGGLPGVALGALFWRDADPDVLRFLIGFIAVGFVLFVFARSRGLIPTPKRPAGTVFGLVAGCGAGFTSFVSHAGGPPAAIYLLSRGLSKTAYQATSVVVFWVLNAAKAVPYAFLGMFTVESLTVGLTLVPAALVGAWIGVKAHRAIPEALFFGVTYTLLICTGSKLIFDSLF